MKQTKPFGSAFVQATRAVAEATLPMPLQATASDDAMPAGSGTGSVGADIFNVAPSRIDSTKAVAVPAWRKILKDALVALVSLAAVFVVYVGMRDSMLLAAMLDQVTTEETVMVCKDGTVYYPDFSITDRLLNRGRLVCTDWRVQRGYLTIPRR